MRGLSSKAAELLHNKSIWRVWRKTVGGLACIVVFCTTYALILPAITMEKGQVELTCTLQTLGVHTHTEECCGDDGELVCGYADYVIHTHNAECYDSDGSLVCSLDEIKAHTHTEECYDAEGNLTCPLDEIEAHTHTEECFTLLRGELICGLKESDSHQHSDDCYLQEKVLTCGKLETKEHIHGGDCFEEVVKESGEDEQVTDTSSLMPMSSADYTTVDKSDTEAVSSFRIWIWEGVNGANKVYENNAGISDVLKYTQGSETYYLIPISYFADNLKDKGYTFNGEDPGSCPFIYAPDAGHNRDNLTDASYVKVENDGDNQAEAQWYVQVQDTGTYGPPPRSNIYYKYYKEYPVITDNITPAGTVINLFDYWITEQNNADNYDPDTVLNSGINNDHAFKFRAGKTFNNKPNYYNVKGLLNQWTKNASVLQGIVQNKLGTDGYPALSGDPKVGLTAENFPDANREESLAYLFDPTNDAGGYKETHRNVGGLLQIDTNGYYYYDSSKNFAEFDKDVNGFTLYKDWGVKTGGSSPNGQFFPFNSMKEVSELPSTNERINHYFGMTLSTRFIQKYDGHTTSSRSSATTFEFAGDDDVWIFIDGVLVADLGGIHDRSSVKIDFSTGDVIINKTESEEAKPEKPVTMIKTTLRAMFEATLDEGETLDEREWNGNTFANNTMHSLKFYYLERGNTDSNLYLKYNLTEIPATSVFKVDQYGESVEGAVFAVYATDEKWDYLLDDDNNTPVGLSQCSYDTNPVDGVITITSGIHAGKTITPEYTGTTDSGGEMVFIDEDDVPYSLKELQTLFGGDHFILREVDVPEGYRLVSDEIRLYISGNVLLCDNTYDSGVWASPTLLVTSTDQIYSFKDNRANAIQYHVPDTSGNGTDGKVNGTLFAVVFKYTGPTLTKDDGTPVDGYETLLTKQEHWAPVYGNDEGGYKIMEVKDPKNLVQAAIDTAREAEQYGRVEFALSASGSMQLEMKNLPGDIKRYYYMLGDDKSKTEYTVAYYWTSADSLSGATADNTKRIDADAGTNKITGAYDFDRTFGATIGVPNLTNRLFAQKLDADGTTKINGANFALYEVREENGEIYYVTKDATTQKNVLIHLEPDKDKDNRGTAKVNDVEGSYEIDENSGVIKVTIGTNKYDITPVDVKTTLSKNAGDELNPSGEDGTATFTNLLQNSYYLREIKAPKGYEINPTEVMVLVTEDAIYANAGDADDDVTVARGPGYVVSTLDQFASKGQIDNTLTWVYEQMLISPVSKSFSDVSTALKANGELNVGNEDGSWKYLLDSKNEKALITYLRYDKEHEGALFNYLVNEGRYEGTDTNSIGRRLYTSQGWSYYLLYQDYDWGEEHVTEGANYKKLINDDGTPKEISNLFSRSTYVQVADKRAVDLEISKTVKNPPEGAAGSFQFTVSLSDASGVLLTDDEYSYAVYNINDETGDRIPAVADDGTKIGGTITGGTGEITLSHNQVAVIKNLPEGATYTVTEEEPQENYDYFTTAVKDKDKDHAVFSKNSSLAVDGTLNWGVVNGVVDATSTVDFTNAYPNDLTILKYEAGNTDKGLQGAMFVLYVAKEDGTPMCYYSENGDWVQEKSFLTSDTGGEIHIRIPDGEYILEEKNAPEGYTPIAEKIRVTVSGGKITNAAPNEKVSFDEDGLTLRVPNSTGYELPENGGSGTFVYTLSGAFIMLSAALLYIKSRRKKEVKSFRTKL